MEKSTQKEIDIVKAVVGDTISKRFTISQETYKAIKIKAIELELDKDGKITPDILGKTIDAIIDENKWLELFKHQEAQKKK